MGSPPESGSDFPILVVAVIGILGTAFLLLGYYMFVLHWWHRIRFLPQAPPALPLPEPPRGLSHSLIRLIPVVRFREEAMGSMDCAVCLCDLKQGERLRVIPNCCHAFHIDCIDVWLQTHPNCPLCRCAISSHALSSARDPAGEGFLVIEIHANDLDHPRFLTEPGIPGRTLRFKDDESILPRDKDDAFRGGQPLRRSLSMDSRFESKLQGQDSSNGRGITTSFFSFGSRNPSLPV